MAFRCASAGEENRFSNNGFLELLDSAIRRRGGTRVETARRELEEAAKEFEHESSDAIRKEDADTRALLEQEGMKVVEMTGAGRDKFLDAAAASSWDRLESRDPANVEKLRELFN